jgi:putative AlgH/UPF0301 family transcriptional regulator
MMSNAQWQGNCSTGGPLFHPNMIVVALSTGGSFRQPIDTHSNVFENAEQDHVVDASPDKNDGKALVHAGFGDSLGGLANLAGFP